MRTRFEKYRSKVVKKYQFGWPCILFLFLVRQTVEMGWRVMIIWTLGFPQIFFVKKGLQPAEIDRKNFQLGSCIRAFSFHLISSSNILILLEELRILKQHKEHLTFIQSNRNGKSMFHMFVEIQLFQPETNPWCNIPNQFCFWFYSEDRWA